MDLTQNEFEEKFREVQDLLLQTMAENTEISMDKFYSVACFLENLSFFSPVLYSMLKNKNEDPEHP